MTLHAHFLVAETAEKMAYEYYEEIMKDNKVYRKLKAMCPDLTPEELQKRWVKMAIPGLLEPARHTLAQLLSTNLAEDLKATISDALIKDNTLRKGRNNRRSMQ